MITRHAILFGLGFSIQTIPWALVVVAHQDLFRGQLLKHSGGYDFLSISFYLTNLLNEVHRDHLGLRLPSFWFRSGLWLFLTWVSGSFVWLTRYVRRERRQADDWLLTACLILPALMAAFVKEKRFYYLMTVAPVFAILVARGLSQLLSSGNGLRRTLAVVILSAITLQGASGIIGMHRVASESASPIPFFKDLRSRIPAQVTVIGPQPYWLAFPEGRYRSIVLAALLSNPDYPNSGTFTTGLTGIQPAVLILHPSWMAWLETGPAPETQERVFWEFMEGHQVVLLAYIRDPFGEPVQIYQLQR